MVNIMHSLYTSNDALRINQAAMSVVSNNIANMNTEGYSKQRLDLKSVTFNAGSVNQSTFMQPGTVAIDKVTRYQDEFLNGFIMQEKSSLGYDEQLSKSLEVVEGYFNEVEGTGLTGAFKSYFTAAQNLTNDPTSKVARSNFVAQADNVAKEFNAKYEQLTSYRESLVGDGAAPESLENSEIGKLTDDINNKLDQIAELNRQIAVFSGEGNAQPNALLDKRQLLLDQISEQIPIISKYQGNSMDLYVGNTKLIEDGEKVASFQVEVGDANNPAKVSIVNNAKPPVTVIADYQTSFTNEQGSLKAMLNMGGNGTGSILDNINQLDTLAQQFAKGVNAIQLKSAAGNMSLKMNSSTNTLEPATENIFLNAAPPAVYNANAITSKNIMVNQTVMKDPFEVATAYGPVTAGVVDDSKAIGNNNNAMSFLNMRDVENPLLDGLTVENRLYAIASDVGNASALAQDNLDTQQTAVQQLADKKQALVGVSLDEELVDLMKYQKAYQASAQVFSVVNQMLEVIVSMVK